MHKSEFDQYSENHDAILAQSIPSYLNDNVYFAEYKIALISHFMKMNRPLRILDFGCGSGRSFPFLSQYFPHSELFGYDPSTLSLAAANTRASPVKLIADLASIPANYFDVIIATNLFHHIMPSQRLSALHQCKKSLTKHGQLFIFEHNPVNPVTRWIFSHCPLDAEATMIPIQSMSSLISIAKLNIKAKGYTLFFPRQLSLLRKLEPLLKYLPLGAQYYVQITN